MPSSDSRMVALLVFCREADLTRRHSLGREPWASSRNCLRTHSSRSRTGVRPSILREAVFCLHPQLHSCTCHQCSPSQSLSFRVGRKCPMAFRLPWVRTEGNHTPSPWHRSQRCHFPAEASPRKASWSNCSSTKRWPLRASSMDLQASGKLLFSQHCTRCHCLLFSRPNS